MNLLSDMLRTKFKNVSDMLRTTKQRMLNFMVKKD